MNTRNAELIRQRQRALLARSAAQRQQMVAQWAALRRPLQVADRAQAGWAWLRAHPEWPLGGVLLWALWRPRGVLRWAGRAWWAWRSWQQLRRQWLPPGPS